MTTLFTVLWILITVVFAVVEFVGIAKGTRFTFSWHVWWLRTIVVTRGLTFGIWHWAGYHFWYEPSQFFSTGLDDLIIFLGTAVIGAVFFDRRGAKKLGR